MKKLLLFFGFALFTVASAVAQRTITGTVTDQEGEPLIGAAVQVKDGEGGVVTDFDGNYSIDVPSGRNVLVISYVGFLTKEVPLGASNVVNVVLEPDSEILEEVVVVGYGQKRPEETVGQVAQVGSEKIETVPIGTFDQILQGQATGLLVLGGSGQPGTSAGNVVIRGENSISGSSAPLYIIDGVRATGGDFSALNPNDIASVSVLKDASQTSIYGVGGANGVILVTTKQGQKGRTSVQYRGQYGVNDFTRDEFDLMNSTQKLAFEEDSQRGIGWILSRENPANMGLPEDVLAGYDATLDSLRGINTNWRDVIIQQGNTQSHELNFSGGGDLTKFFVSGSYFDQEGQIIESTLKRGTLRFNVDITPKDYLTFGLRSTVGFSRRDFITSENGVNLNNPFAMAYLKNPYEQVRLADGSYQFGAVGRNHFEDQELNTNTTNQFKGVGSAFIEVRFLKNFTAKTNWGIDYRDNRRNRIISGLSRLGTTVNPGSMGLLSRSSGLVSRYTGYTTLNWAKRLDAQERHRLEVLVGNEVVKRLSRSFSFTGYGPDPEISTPAGIPNGDPNLLPTVGGGESRRNNIGFFGRVDYSFDDKYFISGGARRDGSSVFGANNRWANFWNAGVSWIASREPFLAGNNTISFLRVYANYGTAGSDNAIGDFQALGAFNTINYNAQVGIIPSVPESNDLQWEVTKQSSAGVEYGLFDDRIQGVVNFYREDVDDLFITQQLSRVSGFSSLEINAGQLRNQGIEFELSGDIIRNSDMVWNLGFQAAINDNEIISLAQVDEFEQGTSIIREGLPLGSHYVVEWAGVDPATGNPLYRDLDGNVTTEFSSDNAVATFGTSQPKWNGGVNTSFRWKDFSVTALGIFVAERTIFNNQSFFQENPNFAQFNQFASMVNVWREPGDVTNLQRIGTARQFSSKDLEDASFFRLRNVTVSYNLGSVIPDNILQNVRVYVQGQNLLTFTKFTGFDPEISNNIAQYEYPAQRTWTLGVDVTL